MSDQDPVPEWLITGEIGSDRLAPPTKKKPKKRPDGPDAEDRVPFLGPDRPAT